MRAEGDARVRVESSAKLELCTDTHTRLLLAAPFPAEVARRHGFLASGAVGLLLGAVRAQDVRPLCESWAAWADSRLHGIAAAWKGALASLPR